MSHLIYGQGWHNGWSLMRNAVTESQARERYEAGLPISIACGTEELEAMDMDALELVGEQPAEWELFAELTRNAREPLQDDVVHVRFFNFWGTRVAEHTFNRRDDERLFLREVAEYDFATNTGFVEDNEWTVMTVHYFRPDGTSEVTERRVAADGSREERRTEHHGGDFSNHWEPVPAWGDWASITRRDRSRPA